MMRVLLIYIILGVCWSACAYQKVLRSKDFNYKLKAANDYYDKGKYDKAQNLYYEISPYFKASDQYEFVVYRYAYCSYLMKDYATSQLMFKDYLANFPTSDRNEEVAYMEAKSYYLEAINSSHYLDASNTYKAMNFFQLFLQNYPNTAHYKEVVSMILQCNARLEIKDLQAAEQYFNMERYNAAGIYYGILSNKYSESPRADEYKYKAVLSFYKYAELSLEEKKRERYEKVIKEYQDFINRFPDSKYLVQANTLNNLSSQIIHKLPAYESNVTNY